MIFDRSVWLTITFYCGFINGYCLYGDTFDCAFKCHCVVDSECDGGICPSGCDEAPLGYNWRGPACQIGNVGLHKSADMTAKNRYRYKNPPTAALDGVSPGMLNGSCAHPDLYDIPAEWWTDLGDLYKIYNITIYGRTNGAEYRLQQFDLTVYNTSYDHGILCGYHHDIIYTYSTITCSRPVIGRYVHFKRKGGGQIRQSAICEVVIIGHKYIDCSHCPVGVPCNDVTGCTQCFGSYPPDCKRTCESGYYGPNCRNQCGQCKDRVTCDNQNDRCYNGCQLWWPDGTCQVYIEKSDGTKNLISLRSTTNNSIEIEWQRLTGINKTLKEYYGYLIQYKDDTTGGSYREAVRVNYTLPSYWKIENLNSYTDYSIEIKPFRMFGNNREYGFPYPVLRVKTKCGAPDLPILKSVEVESSEAPQNIKVEYYRLSDLKPTCNNITFAWIEYRLSGTERWLKEDCEINDTIFRLPPFGDGTFDVRVTIENDGGISSSSIVKSVKIRNSPSSFSTYYITIIVILLGIIVTLAVFLWKLRRQQIKHATCQNIGHVTQLEPIAQNTPSDQQPVDVDVQGIQVHGNREPASYSQLENNGITQYEDVTGPIPVETGQNTYEDLADEIRAIYENRTLSGPYAELKK